MSIRHIVLWKLATEVATEKSQQTEEIRAALEALIEEIPQIQGLTVRPNVLHQGDNYDVVLDSFFENADDLAAYASHPAHLRAGAVVKKYAQSRAAVDVEF